MAVTQSELEARIQKQSANLSKRLQQVARYILDNPSGVAFGTTSSIAADAGVHASALIRFAQAFGFDGFSDMQKLFKDKLIIAAPDYQVRIESVLNDQPTHDEQNGLGWLKQISRANTHALEDMCNQVDDVALDEAITLLNKAPLIHIQGVRRSFPTACYFSYLLNNIGRKSHLIDNVGQMSRSQSNLMSEGETLFAISFAPYAQETQEIVEEAKLRGLSIISLTDSQLSPLIALSDVCIKIKEAEIHSFRSLTGSISIIQALMLGLIHHSTS
ncbi:MAG: MurR/RpiR family transcriptional regulator [Paraglaciecola sp.]|uniref:MurR/RpiR family transcriptional regulator n=1 Tax=Paraglaciecola sp. TaxID=1920173 RepID=UPI0032671266